MCRRVLKNRPPPEEPEIDLYKLPLMKSTSVQQQSIHSINGAIGNELTSLSTC